jgi:hypothetical protein
MPLYGLPCLFRVGLQARDAAAPEQRDDSHENDRVGIPARLV